MNDPFQLIFWAIGIGLAWVLLTSITGLDDWLKTLVGKTKGTDQLKTKIAALETRVAELEGKVSRAFPSK